MVQVTNQQRFTPMPFSTDRVNLHRHVTPSKNVVLLIHGLNGNGAKTWREIPSELFGDSGQDAFDVALYDYPTLFRRRWGKSANLRFYARQLNEQLHEFVDDYDMAFLIGHSLGGLLARAVARHYLMDLGMDQRLDANRISGLITIASPLTGTPLIKKWFSGGLSELAALERVTQERLEVDGFLASNTIAHNLALPPGRPISLPHYAISAGSDIVVPQHSSIHGAPEDQQHRLLAGHSDILVGNEVPAYIRRCFNERRQVLAQQERLARPTPRLMTSPRRPARYFCLLSDRCLPRWEMLYYETRQARLPDIDAMDQPPTNLDSLPMHCLTVLIDERSHKWRALLDRHAPMLRQYSQQTFPPLIGVIVLTRQDHGTSAELRERLDGLLGGGHAYYLLPCRNISQAEQEIALLMDLVGAQKTAHPPHGASLTSSGSDIPSEERWGDR